MRARTVLIGIALSGFMASALADIVVGVTVSTTGPGASLGAWKNCTGRPAMVVSRRSLKVMVGAIKVDGSALAIGPIPPFISWVSAGLRKVPKL